MDLAPGPSDVPEELVAYIKSDEIWTILCEQWDQKYPANPVHGPDAVEEE